MKYKIENIILKFLNKKFIIKTISNDLKNKIIIYKKYFKIKKI